MTEGCAPIYWNRFRVARLAALGIAGLLCGGVLWFVWASRAAPTPGRNLAALLPIEKMRKSPPTLLQIAAFLPEMRLHPERVEDVDGALYDFHRACRLEALQALLDLQQQWFRVNPLPTGASGDLTLENPSVDLDRQTSQTLVLHATIAMPISYNVRAGDPPFLTWPLEEFEFDQAGKLLARRALFLSEPGAGN